MFSTSGKKASFVANKTEKEDENSQSVTGRGGQFVPRSEYEQLVEQLQDTRQLLEEAERRYQQEKKELLNLRTAQLRSETSKRGQEGEIIARAMQVMSEYETVVRNSEETSLARFAHHMETFEKEWIRRSREFEEQKIAFEASIMEKMRQMLNEHEQDVEKVSCSLYEKLVQAFRGESEMRLEIEKQVMRHAETFKEQYKAILEKEFYNRCKMFDEKVAERERNLVLMLQEERKKIIAAENEARKQQEGLHVRSLEDAMRDLSRLREQLVREHQEQQTEEMREFIARREELQQEHERLIEDMNKKTLEMHQKCIADVVEAQNKMKDLHVRMAAKEAEMAMLVQEAESKSDQAVIEKIMEVRKEVEQQWSLIVEKERAKFAEDVQQINESYRTTINRIRNEQAERESALLSSYEQRVVQVEEAAESRWSSRMSEAMLGLERHVEVVQMLRRDNETMAARIDALVNEVQLKAVEMEGAIGAARREQDALWHQRIEEMRQRYDKLLDEALSGVNNMPHVSQAEYQRALQSVREWEERCVTLKQQCEVRLEEERARLHNVWVKRLEEERAQCAEWEAQQRQHFSAMREAFFQDIEAKESSAAASQRVEREALQKDFLQQLRDEKRRCDVAIAQAHDEAREKCAAVCKEQEEAFQERTRLLDERIAQWEGDVKRREEELYHLSLRMGDEAQQKAIDRIQEERQALQSLYDRKFNELRDEQLRWESEKCILQQQLATQYSEHFVRAKTEMRQHVFAVITAMMSYQEECEASWLQFRENELVEFRKERLAYKKLKDSQCASDVAAVQACVNDLIKSEQLSMEERERVLFETLQNTQKSIEDSALERAMQLLEEQRQTLYETNCTRVEEQQKLFEDMKNSLLEKTWLTEADQRAEIQRIQCEHECSLEKERQRWQSAENELRMELQAQKQQFVEQLRKKEEEMQRNYDLLLEKERCRHEVFVTELRREHQSFIAEEKRRAEMMRREREAAFDAERKQFLERMERQSREQEQLMNERIRLLQEEFDNLMRTATANSHRNHEEYIAQVKELQQRYVRQLEEQKKELCRKHEESLSAMHAALEARLGEQAAVEAEVQRRFEDSRAALRDETEAKYRAFMEQQIKRAEEEKQVREMNTQKMEKMYHNQLTELRKEMEGMLSSHLAESCGRAEEVATQSRINFEKEFQSFYTLLEEERKRCVQLEDKLRDANMQMDALRVTHEQQKLEALREVQTKYEDLYKEMREALRVEREEWARRALGEEEQRLLRELTSREERRRRQADTPTAYGVKDISLASPVAKAATTMAPAPVATTVVGRNLLLSDETLTASTQKSQQHKQHNARVTPVTPRDLVSYDNNSCEMPYDFDEVKLQQLWDVIELPEAERQQKMRRWSQLPPPQRFSEIQAETRRLELQLPLLEVITRREFVIHRLKELEKSFMANGVHNSEQMEEMQRELVRLTEYLKSEIPLHEAAHGCIFRFRGTRYMDTLL